MFIANFSICQLFRHSLTIFDIQQKAVFLCDTGVQRCLFQLETEDLKELLPHTVREAWAVDEVSKTRLGYPYANHATSS